MAAALKVLKAMVEDFIIRIDVAWAAIDVEDTEIQDISHAEASKNQIATSRVLAALYDCIRSRKKWEDKKGELDHSEKAEYDDAKRRCVHMIPQVSDEWFDSLYDICHSDDTTTVLICNTLERMQRMYGEVSKEILEIINHISNNEDRKDSSIYYSLINSFKIYFAYLYSTEPWKKA